MAGYCVLPASVKRQEDVSEAEVETWVLSAQTGDPEAFDQLYRLYYRRMFLWMRSHAGNPDEAEDLVQELFALLLTDLVDYEPREGVEFRAWLYGRAKFVLRRHVWDWTEHQAAVEVEVDRLQRGQADPHAAPDELSAPVLSALESLPAGQRRSIELRFLDGLPRPTVSAMLGCTESAVKNSSYEALKKLRRALAGLASSRREPGRPPEGATVFTLKEAAVHSGRSRRALYSAVNEQRLASYWVDGQRVVTAEDLAAYGTGSKVAVRVLDAVPNPRLSVENHTELGAVA